MVAQTQLQTFGRALDPESQGGGLPAPQLVLIDRGADDQGRNLGPVIGSVLILIVGTLGTRGLISTPPVMVLRGLD